MKFSKYNKEGYYDPTAYEAFTNIEAERRAAQPSSSTVNGFRPIVFICSPYADDPLNNERRAIRYCQFAVHQGYILLRHTSTSPDFWTNETLRIGSSACSLDTSC